MGTEDSLSFVFLALGRSVFVEMLLMVSEVLSREVTLELRPQRSQRMRHVMMWGQRGHTGSGPDVGAGCDLRHLLLDVVTRVSDRQRGRGCSNSSPPVHTG